jgi:hypothetical protein
MAVGRIDPLALREQLPVPATVALSLSFLLFPFFLFLFPSPYDEIWSPILAVG